MSFWRPRRSLREGWGALFLALLLAFEGYIFSHLLRDEVSLLTFGKGLAVILSLPLLAFLSYRFYESLTLEYALSRDALIIFHAGSREIIPLGEIEQVWEGDGPSGKKVWWWPGFWLGKREAVEGKEVIFYTTVPPARGLWLAAGERIYCLSPEDIKGFLEALKLRRELGPVRKVRAESHPSLPLALPLWKDRTGLSLLILAGLLNILLFGYLCGRYPSPSLRLGWLGGLILLFNSVLGAFLHRYERAGAYLLWFGAAFVQIIFWLAALEVMSFG